MKTFFYIVGSSVLFCFCLLSFAWGMVGIGHGGVFTSEHASFGAKLMVGSLVVISFAASIFLFLGGIRATNLKIERTQKSPLQKLAIYNLILFAMLSLLATTLTVFIAVSNAMGPDQPAPGVLFLVITVTAAASAICFVAISRLTSSR